MTPSRKVPDDEMFYETHDSNKNEQILSSVQRTAVDSEKTFVSGWDRVTTRILRIVPTNSNEF